MECNPIPAKLDIGMAKKRAPSILDPYAEKIRTWREDERLSFTAIAEKLHQEYGVEVKHNTVHYFLKRRKNTEEEGESDGKDTALHELLSTLEKFRQELEGSFKALHTHNFSVF